MPRPVVRPTLPEAVADFEEDQFPQQPVETIPPENWPAEHVVKRDEDVYAIAAIYGIDGYTLAISNNLKPPFAIAPGQRLKLPAGEARMASAATGAADQTGRPMMERKQGPEPRRQLRCRSHNRRTHRLRSRKKGSSGR
ncbi:MAG: LysM peptidoglycan-binding domain-containing protein [Rhodospirillales bacterium]|nr:LysM peptidoglycan-binding domain-containing protein [Rhodospirillales bacterium]